MPFCAGFVLFAPDLVEFVLGDEWEPAVGLLQGMAVAAGAAAARLQLVLVLPRRGQPAAAGGRVGRDGRLRSSCSRCRGCSHGASTGSSGAGSPAPARARGPAPLRPRQLLPGVGCVRLAARALAPVAGCRRGGRRGPACVVGRTATPAQAIAEIALFVAVTAALTWSFERGLLREAGAYVRRAPDVGARADGVATRRTAWRAATRGSGSSRRVRPPGAQQRLAPVAVEHLPGGMALRGEHLLADVGEDRVERVGAGAPGAAALRRAARARSASRATLPPARPLAIRLLPAQRARPRAVSARAWAPAASACCGGRRPCARSAGGRREQVREHPPRPERRCRVAHVLDAAVRRSGPGRHAAVDVEDVGHVVGRDAGSRAARRPSSRSCRSTTISRPASESSSRRCGRRAVNGVVQPRVRPAASRPSPEP